MNIDINVTIQVTGTANDLGKLSDLFAALGNSGLKVSMTSGGATAPGPDPQIASASAADGKPAAKSSRIRRKPGNNGARKGLLLSAEPDEIAEKYSAWFRSKYKPAVRNDWDPQLTAAREAYLAAAGTRAASGQSHKSWSINRFKRETAALGVAGFDSEGLPSTEKSGPKGSRSRARRKK